MPSAGKASENTGAKQHIAEVTVVMCEVKMNPPKSKDHVQRKKDCWLCQGRNDTRQLCKSQLSLRRTTWFRLIYFFCIVKAKKEKSTKSEMKESDDALD